MPVSGRRAPPGGGPGWPGAAALAVLGAALGAAATAAVLLRVQRGGWPAPPERLPVPELAPAAAVLPRRMPTPMPPPPPPIVPPPPPALRVALDPNGRGDPPATFGQVGYLRPAGGGAGQEEDSRRPAVLPLYGEPSAVRRGRWSYYTLAPGPGVKVPVRDARGRDCMDELGCEELHSGDRVSAPDAAAGPLEVERYRPPPPLRLW